MPTRFCGSLTVLLTVMFIQFIAHAEDAAALEKRGLELLHLEATQPTAIAEAAQSFAKAAAAYEGSGNPAKVSELHTFLYWCRKKLTQAEFDALAKSDPPTGERLTGAEATETTESGASSLQHIQELAISVPDKHLWLALSFFEVADRFKGSEAASTAHDRSVAEMQSLPPREVLSFPRDPIPPADALAAKEKLFREVYEADFEAAKIEGKPRLLALLTAKIADIEYDRVALYVQYRETLTVAATIPDMLAIFVLSEDLCTNFRADPAIVRKEVLAKATSKNAEISKVLSAARAVAANPADAGSNLIVGQFLAAKDKWSLALPYLAKASDEAVKTVAAKELARPTARPAKIAVADGWWDLGESEKNKEFKRACVLHAGKLYFPLMGEMNDVARARAEKRMAAVAEARSAFEADVKEGQKAEKLAIAAEVAASIPASEKLDISNGMIQGGPIRSNKRLFGGKYKLNGILSWPTVFGGTPWTLTIEPGTTISGGVIGLNEQGVIQCAGTAELPCVFSGVSFTAEYATHVYFNYCIFDKCRFEKTGTLIASNAQGATEWTCRNCIFNAHNFPHWSLRNYDYRFDECVFANTVFPMVAVHDKREKAVSTDHFGQTHSPFTHINNCTLIDCSIPPFLAWAITNSNFYSCKFAGSEVYESDTPLVVNTNYYSNMSGKFPDISKRAKVSMVSAKEPVAKPDLPEKCPLPELQSKLKLMYPDKK